jgi:hypothetical protein
LEEFRQCCILGGHDYFKLKGVALKTAIKVFTNCRKREPEALLVELLPNMPLLAKLFSELLAMKKLSATNASQVIKRFLLADGAFQCPLVLRLPLPVANPNKQLYFSLVAVEKLPPEQQRVVQEHLDFVCGVRPPDPADEWRIASAATATAVAAASEPIPSPKPVWCFLFVLFFLLADVCLQGEKRQLPSQQEELHNKRFQLEDSIVRIQVLRVSVPCAHLFYFIFCLCYSGGTTVRKLSVLWRITIAATTVNAVKFTYTILMQWSVRRSSRRWRTSMHIRKHLHRKRKRCDACRSHHQQIDVHRCAL